METYRLATMAPQLVMSMPLIVIWLVGIGIAAAYRERHPTASMLAIVAFALMFVNAIIGVYTSTLPMMWMEQGLDGDGMAMRMMAIGVARTFFSVVAWALLLVALFKQRP